MIPMEHMPVAKRTYMAEDMLVWAKYWNAVNAQVGPPLLGSRVGADSFQL